MPAPERADVTLDIEAIEDLALQDPATAVQSGTAMLDRRLARASRARVSRAVGVALRSLRDIDGSLHHLENALVAARSIDQEDLVAQVLTSLAPTLAYVGRTDEALAALTEAESLATGFDIAAIRFQRAGLLQRIGRASDALDEYDAALPVLRTSDDRTWEADALQNRAILLIDSGQVDRAVADLRVALEIYEDAGSPGVADAIHNLGMASARRGEIVEAIGRFDQAEIEFSRLGAELASLPAARCEALLAAGLYSNARSYAEKALAAYRGGGLAIDEGEALLWISTAARLEGDLESALDAAVDADRLFGAQQRLGWQAIARSAMLHIREHLGSATEGDVVIAQRLADGLREAGKSYAEADARILAALLATAVERVEVAARELERSEWVARHGTIGLRTAWWLGMARHRLATGDRSGAARSVTAGLAAVANLQATLGSIDLRCHTTSHARRLTSLGLDLAVDSGDNWRIAQFFENSRSGSLSVPQVRPPEDDALRLSLSSLRSVVTKLADPDLEATAAHDLIREQRRLESEILRAQQRVAGSGAHSTIQPTRAQLKATLGGRTAVLYGVHKTDLIGMAIVGGRTRRSRLGPIADMLTLSERLQARLNSLALHGAEQRSELVAGVVELATDLDSTLFPWQLPEDDDDVLIVPPPELFAIPWAYLPTLSIRSFSVAPSARLLLRRRASPSSEPVSVATVLGPGLAHAASSETAAVREAWGESAAHVVPANSEATLNALQSFDVAHLTCHGTFNAANPQFSSLILEDGPLMVCEIERIVRAPEVVVLGACDAGLSDTTRSNEVYGFASSFLFAGATNVVAGTGLLVDDSSTVSIMSEIHAHLARGVHAPRALAELRRGVTGIGSTEWAAAASLVCFGDT